MSIVKLSLRLHNWMAMRYRRYRSLCWLTMNVGEYLQRVCGQILDTTDTKQWRHSKKQHYGNPKRSKNHDDRLIEKNV
jgi:hypothetical protein